MKKLFAAAASIAVLGLLSAIPAHADGLDRRLIIDNQTDKDMWHMYVSNVGTNGWGPDQLGSSDVISAHHYLIWNIDDGSGYCRFDFKFVDEDGDTYYKRNYNVCTQVRLNIVDN